MRAHDSRAATIEAFLEQVKQASGRIFVSVITLTEIEDGFYKHFGQQPASDHASQERQRIERFFLEHPPLPVDQHTVEPYARIRAGVFAKYSTPKGKGSGVRERVPEDLRVSGKELGIDERDLLIVATAAQYNLVLVTCDGQAGMLRIIEVARDIASQGVLTQLRVHTIEFPPSAAPAC